MFVITLVVAKWRPFLMGARFVIPDDHVSLKHMVEKRIHTPAQQKWLSKLLGYELDIEYKLGAANRVSDALSRKAVDPQTPLVEEGYQCCSIMMPSPIWLQSVSQMCESCEDLRELMSQR